MFVCKYCGVNYQTFQSICPSCSAPYQAEMEDSIEETKAKTLANKIRQVCESYLHKNFSENRDFKEGELVSNKKRDVISKSFREFPIGKEIFLHCDASPIRSGKRGFLICEDGIYWQNAWTTSTNRNFLSWDVLINREITNDKFDLFLGKGDAIGLSGLGTDEVRKDVVQLFRDIQKVLKD